MFCLTPSLAIDSTMMGSAAAGVAFKPALPTTKFTFTSSTKRSFAFNDDADVLDIENVDPAEFSSKRSKGTDGKAKPAFNLVTPLAKDILSKAISKKNPSSTTEAAKYNLPSGINSGPAGRTAKPKRVGDLSSKRRSIKTGRAEPSRKGRSVKPTNAGLAFSLDTALTNTLVSYDSVPAAKSKARAKSTGLSFEIREDSFDEHNAIVMEHSTCILDISSDDEAVARAREDRGKENIPPPDHVAVSVNRSIAVEEKKARRAAHAHAMDEDRSPLGVLPAEPFYGAGLDSTSVEVIPDDEEDKDAPAINNNEHGSVVDDDAPTVEQAAPVLIHEDAPAS